MGSALVGYIPRADAKAVGEELAALVGPGAVQCRAEIAGAYEGDGEPSPWSIALDIARPLALKRRSPAV